MTDIEINIKIAEACGWRFYPMSEMDKDSDDYQQRKQWAVMCWVPPGRSDWETTRIPNYVEDLNAIHEAEKTLGDIPRRDYFIKLWEVVNGQSSVSFWTTKNMHNLIALTSASARQRALAFIKTLYL